MMRLTATICIWLGLVIGGADAVPAKRPYEPPAPLQLPVGLDLRGSTWSGFNEIVKAPWVVVFEADGQFSYVYNNANYRNGTWKLEGNVVYYETNKKYSEFRGILQGDVIEGNAWNVNGLRWKIRLQRGPAAK